MALSKGTMHHAARFSFRKMPEDGRVEDGAGWVAGGAAGTSGVRAATQVTRSSVAARGGNGRNMRPMLVLRQWKVLPHPAIFLSRSGRVGAAPQCAPVVAFTRSGLPPVENLEKSGVSHGCTGQRSVLQKGGRGHERRIRPLCFQECRRRTRSRGSRSRSTRSWITWARKISSEGWGPCPRSALRQSPLWRHTRGFQ